MNSFGKLHFISLIFLLGLLSCESNNQKAGATEDIQAFYEVNLRQFGHKGLIHHLTNDIDRLYSMSIDAVILPPLQPIGEENRIDFLGSPFAVKAFTKRDSTVIKSQEKLADCVNGFHEKNISFFMDWHPFIASSDNVWFLDHPEWKSTKNIKSFLDDPVPLNYQGSVLLDLDNPDVQKAVYNAMILWITTYNLDGLRIYNAHQVPQSFWNKYGRKLKKTGATFIAFQEHKNLDKIFSYSGNFEFIRFGVDTYLQKITPAQLLSALSSIDYSPENRKLLNFTTNIYSNALEASDFSQLGGLYRPIVGLAFLTGGAFLMSTGQEVPISKSLKLYRHKVIDWQGYLNDDFFRQLILLKKRNKALRYDDISIQSINTNNENVIGFKKEKDGNVIYGFFNLSLNEQEIRLDEDIFNVNHYINNKVINMRKGEIIKLPKTQYIILSNV